MAMGYCTLRCPPKPFSLGAGASTASVVHVADEVTPVWSDGTVDTPWSIDTTATNAYGGTTFDSTILVWLLLARKGNATPTLVKEADFATIDSLVSGATWAQVARIEGSDLIRIPQA